jgi:hypothetical protein
VLQNVILRTYTFKLGVNGGSYVGVVPRMHNMFGRSLARHLQLGR